MGRLRGSPNWKLFAVVASIIIITTTLSSAFFFASFYGSSSKNLAVNVTLSSHKIVQGQNVTVTVEVYNSGMTTLNLKEAVHNYPFFKPTNYTDDYIYYMGPICGMFPLGLVEVTGNYTGSNLSMGTPVEVAPPVAALCPAETGHMFPASVQIFPHSSDVNIRYPFGGSTSSVLRGSVRVSGYWSITGGNYTFQTFQPGVYTFTGEDGWGQYSIQHLTVKSS